MFENNSPLIHWLQQQLAATDLVLEDYVPAEQGYSNETIIFTASFKQNGESKRQKFVQRFGIDESDNVERRFFKEYDLERQCRVVQYIGEHSHLPVPAIIGLNLTADKPYYVMECIEGCIPLDGRELEDTYFGRGCVFEDTPEQRRQYWLDLVGKMAELHKVPVSNAFRDYFQRKFPGQTHLEKEVAWWIDFYNWGKDGADVPMPESDPHIEWLANNIPSLDDDNIVWQDGRPANTIVQDHAVAGMLDWELAGIGPGELDLFFHLFVHGIRCGQNGGKDLEGIPTEAEQIAHYEKISGRKIRHTDFFRRFTRIKGAILQLCVCRAAGMTLDQISFTGVLDDAEWSLET